MQAKQPLKLYSYQRKAVTESINYLITKNCISVLIQSATGSGKTVIAAGLISELLKLNPNYKFMIVVPSMTLVEQFYGTLADDFHLSPSVLHNTLLKDKNGREFRTSISNIVISMPETFAGIIDGTSKLKLPKGWAADFLFMDEAHKNTAASSQAARDFFACKIVGLTATPRREQNKEGEHLWDWYQDRLVIAASTKQLIEGGFIVRPFVTRRPANSVVVTDWLEYTMGQSNKRTMLIAEDTGAAMKYVEQFTKAGIRAQLITAGSDVYGVPTQPYKERQKYFKQFEDGYIDVLVSVNSLCEGFDCKPAKYLIVARDMVSIALVHQTGGRVLRAFEGKDAGYIFDYGNNVELDIIETKVWSHLDYAPNVKQVDRKTSISASDIRNFRLSYSCEACPHVYDAAAHKSCPACNEPVKLKCRTTPRELLTKACGAEAIDFASWRLLKERVKVAKTSLPEYQPKRLAEVSQFFFANNKAFDASNPARALINYVFAKDLNLDDTIEFCPVKLSKAVDLLAA